MSRAPIETLPSRPPPPSGDARVVLLVDDDAAVLSAIGKCLGSAGFKVLDATNAALALETLRRGKLEIDLLCTDWMMPGRPVRDLIDEFRRLHAAPVLVCSGYAPEETGISHELVDDFLAKPFTGDELLRRIFRLLDDTPATRREKSARPAAPGA